MHCQTVVEALRKRGHEIAVLTSNHGLDKDGDVPNEIGVIRSLKLHGLFGHPFVGILPLQQIRAAQPPDLARRFARGETRLGLCLELHRAFKIHAVHLAAARPADGVFDVRLLARADSSL